MKSVESNSGDHIGIHTSSKLWTGAVVSTVIVIIIRPPTLPIVAKRVGAVAQRLRAR
jgi:hypothetical protein